METLFFSSSVKNKPAKILLKRVKKIQNQEFKDFKKQFKSLPWKLQYFIISIVDKYNSGSDFEKVYYFNSISLLDKTFILPFSGQKIINYTNQLFFNSDQL